MRPSRIPIRSKANFSSARLTEIDGDTSQVQSRQYKDYSHKRSRSPEHPWKFLEEEWTHVPTEEPLSDEMKTRVRLELESFWNSFRRDAIYRRETKFCWMREDSILKIGETPIQIGPAELERFCNKPTTFYFDQPAQRNGRCPGLIFGCIYEEWFRCHHGDPNIEFGHFFASPVQITSAGASTVAGVVEAHKSICDQVASLLARSACDKPESDSTDGSKARWPNPNHYKLPSLCRTIIVIIDQLNLDTGPNPGQVVLQEQSRRKSVLMVRTGDESHLSAPIDFQSIKAECLPLNKADVTDENLDFVRVSLATAVDFVAKLQWREDAAFSDSRGSLAVDGSLCPTGVRGGAPKHHLSATTWASELIQEAEIKGYDNVCDTWSAIRRLQARDRGGTSLDLTPYHFDGRWK